MSTPNSSRPIPIVAPSSDSQEGITTPSQVGTPDLRALRARYGGTPPTQPIPPFTGSPSGNLSASPRMNQLRRPSVASPSPRPGSPSLGAIHRSGSRGSIHTPPDLDALTDEEKAKIIRKHLVSRQERQGRASPGVDLEFDPDDYISNPGANSSGRGSQHAAEDNEPFPLPYDAPGGDITHDVYKWQAAVQQRPRASSFSGPSNPRPPVFEHIREPGGFRRAYVLTRADEQGLDEPVISNNFIEFLYLFGHFAGEDLEEDEEFSEETDEEAGITRRIAPGGSQYRALPEDERNRLLQRSTEPLRKDSLLEPIDSETSPLIGRRVERTIKSSAETRAKSRRRRRSSIGPHGDATVTQAVFMLLKSFIGTGVLFLGKAFYNGGLLFSVITVMAIALISLYSFLLLVKVKWVTGGSFGDIGGILYGNWMRQCILFSIVLSQLGFVTAYTIFVAENFQAFVLAVSNCKTYLPIYIFIACQMVIFLPLSFIRNLAKLSTTALVADAFILVGLIYIFGSEVKHIADNGIGDVKMFNPKDFSLLIGTAVFSFEGIGLVIPITDAMKEPRKFPKALSGVMIFLMFLFAGAGALSYLTFGSKVQAVVLVNLPQDSRFVQSVQFIYSLAILLSAPLQLFPAIRIMENAMWTRSGKVDPRVKWEKNGFRASLVILCSIVAWLGAADLDKFVAFIGSFACVPLCYVYPAMLHLKACARTRRAKITDWLLIVFGLVAAVYTSVQTVIVRRLVFFARKCSFASLQLALQPAGEGPHNRCS
ncbi:hypothetical protein SISNIDRAFT_412510 [Sistotremastrum niveocremeum HHB9708]|uniref:Amino acid transporter transmembrane domain-containing protein n=2 Tax=Sistotremastraceae TaxID=3402574 RepID=A0A164TMH2_9AGAM|nr:hypothetical protein SISNIDRAFT_412510 [Sistotremastrum niveocremeum HHB9708]KZT42158.1 hypothetical protein SISSUDRAFT_980481 [Sistotremastrum suecicum HHB10207 ss-3]